jgi:hypothetical protein
MTTRYFIHPMTHTRQIKVYIHLTFLSLFVFLLSGQGNLQAQNLDFEEVKVVAPYEPSISDAFKINFNPRIEDTVKVNIAFDYRINPMPLSVKYNMEPLTPARMRGEPLAKIYRGYAKAGLGNYITPYGEVFYNSLRSNAFHYGVHLKHMSSGGKITDYAHSGYSDNEVELLAKRFVRNHTLHAGVNYENYMNHFYGFRPADFPETAKVDTLNKKDYRQRFNFISPNVEVRSNYLDSTKLQHNFKVLYHFLGDSYDASEQRVAFEGALQKTLRDDPLGFAQKQTFHLDLGADYYKNQHLADTTHTAMFKIAPTLGARFNRFNFYVGVNATVQSDTASHMRFYPLAGAEVNLINDILYAYGSLSGELAKNNMRDLTSHNPFMNTSAPYGFMNRKIDIRGGFKGSLSSFATYNLSIGTSNISNYPFFVTDFSEPLANRFAIVYDDVKLFNFRSEIFSNVGERLKIRFASDYYQYTLENELEPWHEPTLKLTLNLRYNIQDKIILSADAFARNAIFARVPNMALDAGLPYQAVEVDGLHIDGNIGIEYRYTKILSVFLNLNNVQNQPLMRWYNYPSHQFNVLGGVTYAF